MDDVLAGYHVSPLIVDAFFSCATPKLPPFSMTAGPSGIRYARNQRVGLSQFLDDGRLPIRNNLSELALRREAVDVMRFLGQNPFRKLTLDVENPQFLSFSGERVSSNGYH